MPTTTGVEPEHARLTPYHWRLLVFLSVACFFEGYDFMALTQVLPQIRAELGLGPADGGILVGVIGAGTVFAYFLVRQADSWGRRRVLTLTIGGYTLLTLFTGLTTDVYTFGFCQFWARLFLIGEWAVSMIYAAEEFPDSQRATTIGIMQAFSSLGAIACAGVVPLLLQTHWGWRTVYFVGVLPLVILAFARRNLRETRRFEELQRSGRPIARRPLLHIFRTPYRGRVFVVALAWALTYASTQCAVTFWKEFALAERGFTDAMVGASISIAAVASMPLVFLSGKLLDVIGRRRGAVVIYLTAALSLLAAYNLHGRWPLTVALVGAIFGASAVLPVLNAYTAELFPTDLRGDAFGWANNVLGRSGYVMGPVLAGVLAERVGWGMAVSATVLFLVAGLGVILAVFPETRGRDLEQTAAL